MSAAGDAGTRREPAPALAVPGAGADPFALFRAWYAALVALAPPNPDAMLLATATPDGAPSLRAVLCKGVEGGRFRFFTSFASRKGRELADNPRAALLFFWPWLERQVRIEGTVARLATAEADAYFASRPRASQLSAYASPQSAPITRAALEARRAAAEARFAGAPVPRPEDWGGFALEPASFEFWVSDPARLHARHVYRRAADQGAWAYDELAP